ncbi:acyl carrier protein [Streptomyces abikoensis]|uniref:Acyl carrier protein n=1 Tax=Streptomyces abikoensis TaxID=97398 RepID=A0ABW7TCP6_9ACTN
MSSTYDVIADILTKDYEVDSTALSAEATFVDLDLDSLAIVELGYVLQQRFGVRLHDLADLATVGDLVAAVDGRRATAEGGVPS